MLKKLALALLPVVLAAFVAAPGTSAGEMHGKGDLHVKLSPAPKVTTKAGGEATFRLDKDGKALHYKLAVKDLENATMGHIHEALAGGVPGSIIAWLYPATGGGPALKEGSFSGTLAEGDIAAEKLAGPLKGKTVKELAEMIGHGKAGIAVHTKQNPAGELWGVQKAMETKGEMKKEMKKEMGGTGY